MKKQTNQSVIPDRDETEKKKFSFEEDVTIHCKRLYRFLYGICHDEDLSKDLLQDTMLCAQRHIMQGFYAEQGALWCWLKTIAQNNLFKHYRREHVQKVKMAEQRQNICDNLGWNATTLNSEINIDSEDELSEEMQEAASNDLDLTRYRIKKNLEVLMKSRFRFLNLTNAERHLIAERHLNMKSFKELSYSSDEAISTVMSRYYKAMKKVQKQLIHWEEKGFLSGELELKDLRRIKRSEDALAARQACKRQKGLSKLPPKN